MMGAMKGLFTRADRILLLSFILSLGMGEYVVVEIMLWLCNEFDDTSSCIDANWIDLESLHCTSTGKEEGKKVVL
jgi:hypothetical protein